MIRIPWCSGSQAGPAHNAAAGVQFPGQHSVCQPQGTRCRREIVPAGSSLGVRMGHLGWEPHLGSVLELPAVSRPGESTQDQVSEGQGQGLGAPVWEDPAAWNSSVGRLAAGRRPAFSFLLDRKGFKSPSSASFGSA